MLQQSIRTPYFPKYARDTTTFSKYAETLLPSPPLQQDSPSFHALSQMAADAGVYLVGGSIPEFDQGRYYNTYLIFSPEGQLLATHRKTHLFDIDIPGKITFMESEILSPGDIVNVVDLPDYGLLRIGICYDIRFPEISTVAARRGCFATVYPAAFTKQTGAIHWTLLARSRAADNQVYVIMCSPARDPSASYIAWVHSMIVDLMAEVPSEADEAETIIFARLDNETIRKTRQAILAYTQRRFDVYKDASIS